jgi:hypothetical protein
LSSWVNTPNYTISNIPWGWGGFFYQGPIRKVYQAVRAVTRKVSAGANVGKIRGAVGTSNYLGRVAVEQLMAKDPQIFVANPKGLPPSATSVNVARAGLDEFKKAASMPDTFPRSSLVTVKKRAENERGNSLQQIDSQPTNIQKKEIELNLFKAMDERLQHFRLKDVNDERVIYVYINNWNYGRNEFKWAA